MKTPKKTAGKPRMLPARPPGDAPARAAQGTGPLPPWRAQNPAFPLLGPSTFQLPAVSSSCPRQPASPHRVCTAPARPRPLLAATQSTAAAAAARGDRRRAPPDPQAADRIGASTTPLAPGSRQPHAGLTSERCKEAREGAAARRQTARGCVARDPHLLLSQGPPPPPLDEEPLPEPSSHRGARELAHLLRGDERCSLGSAAWWGAVTRQAPASGSRTWERPGGGAPRAQHPAPAPPAAAAPLGRRFRPSGGVTRGGRSPGSAGVSAAALAPPRPFPPAAAQTLEKAGEGAEPGRGAGPGWRGQGPGQKPSEGAESEQEGGVRSRGGARAKGVKASRSRPNEGERPGTGPG